MQFKSLCATTIKTVLNTSINFLYDYPTINIFAEYQILCSNTDRYLEVALEYKNGFEKKMSLPSLLFFACKLLQLGFQLNKADELLAKTSK